MTDSPIFERLEQERREAALKTLTETQPDGTTVTVTITKP